MLHPDQWGDNKEYKKMERIITNIAVVNDAAKDARHGDEIILVFNSHRIKIPQRMKCRRIFKLQYII